MQVIASIVNKNKATNFFYCFFLICLLCLLPYWLAYYPACMTSDSYSQWNQALNQEALSDSHPVFYTLLIRSLVNIWQSYGVVIFFNIILFAYVFSSILAYFHKKGISLWYLIALNFIFFLSPTNGRMLVTFWKDITYAIGILMLTFLFVKIILDKTAYTNGKRFLYEILFAYILILNTRHNGILVVLGCSVLLFFLLKKQRKKLAIIWAMVILLISINWLATYSVFKATKGWYTFDHILIRHLSSYLVQNKLSTQEERVFVKIMPKEEWMKSYSPWTHDGYAFGAYGTNYRNDVPTYKDEIRSLFLKKLLNDPRTFWLSEKNITQLIWRPFGVRGSYLNTYATDCGLGSNLQIRQLLDKITTVTNSNERPFYTRYIFWSGATYNVFIVILLMAFLYVQQLKNIFVFVPTVLNNFSLAIAVTAQEFRYVYSSVMIMPLILLFLCIQFSFLKRLVVK